MKIINRTLTAAVLAAMSLMSCSFSGAVKSDNDERKATVRKEFKISDFTKVKASAGIRVVYTEGKATNVAKVATTPSAERYLKVYVKNNVLYAKYENTGSARINGPTIVTVSSSSLNEIDLSSAATFKCAGSISRSNELEIDASSAADVFIGSVSVSDLDIDASSSAGVNIGDANCDKVSADASSAGSIKLGKVTAKNLYVDSSSAGSSRIGAFNGMTLKASGSSGGTSTVNGITASNTVAEASSGGSVKLEGTSQQFSKSSSSGGSVSTSNFRAPGQKTQTTRKKKTQRTPSSQKTLPQEP